MIIEIHSAVRVRFRSQSRVSDSVLLYDTRYVFDPSIYIFTAVASCPISVPQVSDSVAGVT